VRQALSLAVDREKIAALYGRTGRAVSNVLVSPTNLQSPNTSYDFNPDKAAALLTEAGWTDSNGDGIRDKDGVEFKFEMLMINSSTEYERLATVFKEELARAGDQREHLARVALHHTDALMRAKVPLLKGGEKETGKE